MGNLTQNHSFSLYRGVLCTGRYAKASCEGLPVTIYRIYLFFCLHSIFGSLQSFLNYQRWKGKTLIKIQHHRSCKGLLLSCCVAAGCGRFVFVAVGGFLSLRELDCWRTVLARQNRLRGRNNVCVVQRTRSGIRPFNLLPRR